MADLPDSPAELGLPEVYDEWRPHQKEIVSDVVDSFETNDVVLVEAPTGAGKTLIGGAAARALGGRALYLAHTILLQQQQLRTLPEAVTVTGRRNHMCALPVLLGDPLTADEADCPCDLATPGGCSYYDQWFRAMGAKDVALNYAFMTRIVKSRGLRVAEGYGTMGKYRDVIPNPFVGRRLMVCDEGHNLEAALLDADMVDVYQASWERYGFRPPDTTDFRTWLEWASATAPLVGSKYEEKRRANLEDGGETVALDLMKDARRLASLQQTLDGIKDLGGIEASSSRQTVFVGRRPHGWVIQPIWAWDRAKALLFSHADNVMVMSATLGGPKLAARLLGLKENWTHLRIPSTFPIENRPVFYWPVSKMKYGMDDTEKLRQVVALANLAVTKFPDAAGLVHTNSYTLAKYFYERMPSINPETAARLILSSGPTRERDFADFESNPGNRILLTPAATTGVDWDFLGWQMIPKVPYPDLSDDITRLRFEYVTDDGEELGKEVYQNEAAKTLVQAAGRAVRTPTSRGVTVITDEAFWPLFKYIAPQAFPDWFRAAVRWHKE